MMSAVTHAIGELTVTAADGRTLAVAEWGDPGGSPVFSLHGGPGSRLLRHYDDGVYVEAGARVITYDRPGYGGSDRHRGRRIVDCVADVASIADALGVERFGVIGTSMGGPHCLAVAARLPERVTRVTCAVGVAPLDAPDLDWKEGMDPLNVRELGWALEGEEVLTRELEREAAEMLERIAADPARLLGDDWQLPEADRAELARVERQAVIREGMTEAFRNGVFGWVDDDLCLVRPWGFEVEEIRVPARVVYGLTDVLVPRGHGEWLARHVPGAEVITEERGGHIADPGTLVERYRWLAGAA
jgi:pimeloyl-ACP methyl ester carboxylesterase